MQLDVLAEGQQTARHHVGVDESLDHGVGVRAGVTGPEHTRHRDTTLQLWFDVVDVLDAQRELFLAERNYAEARYAYILNVLRLKQAAGIIDEQDVVLVDSWLEESQ